MTLLLNWVKAKWQNRALPWMYALGAYFFLVYGTANYITSKKPEVMSFFFPWESMIPFIPWMIIPYMSSDIIFMIGFLIAKDKDEIFTLAKRVAFVISFSVLCYFIYPLKFAFTKPEVHSAFLKPIYDLLTADLPYNQCPSLHISQGFIFWMVFLSVIKNKWGRLFTNLWFVSVYISTLTVFQHHFVDLLGGQLVALAAFFLFPNRAKTGYRNEQFAYFYYFISCAWLSAAFFTPFMWSVLLSYFALTYFFVGFAYHYGKSELLQKTNGKHSFIMRFAFGHYMFCTWLWWFTHGLISKKKTYAEVVPNLYFGERPRDLNLTPIKKNEEWAVIDLAPEIEEHEELLNANYYYFPLNDMSYPDQKWIHDVAGKIEQLLGQNKKIYVHCRLGKTRSALAVCSYLILKKKMEVGVAFQKVADAKTVRLSESFKNLFQ